jgi:hypothetical protein
MAFAFNDGHITDYHHDGYTIFRGVLPGSLVMDLRAAGDELLEISKRTRGETNARSATLDKVEGELSAGAMKAFKDYGQHPALVDAVQRVLSPGHRIDGLKYTACFFTYPVRPICQDWHRDVDENYAGVDAGEFRALKQDPTFFAQINCALYTDTCLWYVPGSAGRPNTAGELAAAGTPYNGVPGRGRLIDNDLDDKSCAVQERLCLDYCAGMPGGVNVVLEAGDFCLYRPIGWHTGNYAPYRRRLTLHHTAATPAWEAWFARWIAEMGKKK